MLNKLIASACPEDNCPVRKKLSKRSIFLIRLHTAMKSIVAVLIGAFISGMLMLHVKAQNTQTYTQFKQQQGQEKVIELSVQVSMLTSTVKDLSTLYAQLKSEADTTQAMGTGIGIAIMFLQLLGFFVKSKSNNTKE